MSTGITDEQRLVADAAAAFLGDAAAMSRVRAFAESAEALDRALWQGLVEQGWCGLPWPESVGGSGLGWPELVLVCEHLGRRLAPVPFLESVGLAGSLLYALRRDAPTAEGWLQGIATGSVLATGGLEPPPNATLTRSHDGAWHVTGCWPLLAWAQAADLLLLPAREGDGSLVLLAVPTSTRGIRIEPVRGVDLTRRQADVRADAAPLPADAVLARGARAEAALAQARDLAAVALAAEQVGAARQCLDLSVAYVMQREQFGQPVGRFQAVKHRCARMLVAVEAAHSAVWQATATVEPLRHGGGGEPGQAATTMAPVAAQARCLATEAAQFCSAEAIQLHGGVGFTWAFDPHLYFKRAQADSHRLKAVPWWRERVAALVLDAPGAVAGEPEAPAGQADAPGNTEAAFRAEVRAWMQAQLRDGFEPLRHAHGPGAACFDAALAKRWEQRLADGGWTALGWPRVHGGRELPLGLQVAFHEEYARAGGPGRLGHIGETLLAPTLIEHGTPEQMARFLPGIRAGQSFWAQGFSEPSAGSDLANVRTRAVRDEATGEWVIHGQKVWTSWAHESDWIFVLARTDPLSQRHRGLSLLLVPLRQPGVTIRPIRQMTGSAEFNEVFFDGARTEGALHLGPLGEGWKVAMSLLGHERGVSTLGQQAHFRHELDLVLAAARANGMAADPLMRQRLVQAALGLANLRSHALRVLGADRGAPAGAAATTSKFAWSNWRRDLGQLAMDVLGPDGERVPEPGADPDRERLHLLWLGSRADTIYAGTNEIQLNLIAERALGLPR